MNMLLRVVWLISTVSMSIFLLLIAPFSGCQVVAALPFGIVGAIGCFLILLLIGINHSDEEKEVPTPEEVEEQIKNKQ